ncbi:class I SAM-dependent methyltransferase [Jiangella alba]|uniref:Methyltransferase domain-containing protein n=1 Tax=Jiangella alba TaxID=561176 RepID=A0A1H5MKI6_9ACTN|nr:class I SAM-dependent methyltransferase [Jiangella alba]SEE89630.1 Methyltransferase domain-containing protein [Jiangella alba]
MPHDTSPIQEFWNTAAAEFDAENDHGLRDPVTRTAWARRLASWAPSAPGDPLDALDAGCGTGSLSLLLAELGHRVTGVDLAPAMVRLAEAKLAAAGLPGRFLTGDAGRPPLGDQAFDVVLARHVVWTLPDPAAALRDWTGRLRPGGTLILVEGRWAAAGPVTAYVDGAEPLPWDGGVRAADLVDAVRPLVAELRVEDLTGEPELWGRAVDDERYALVATV